MANATTRQTRNLSFRLTKVLVGPDERRNALPRFEISFNTSGGDRYNVFLSADRIDNFPDLQTALEESGYRAEAAGTTYTEVQSMLNALSLGRANA